MPCNCNPRVTVWSIWGFHALLSIVYIAIAIVTAKNIDEVNFAGGSSADIFKSGLMAATVMGILVVCLFLIISPVVMLGRVFGKSMAMSYGVMLGTCFQASLFMLLAGLVLHSAENLASDLEGSAWWSKSDYDTFVATFAFSYILCGTFMVLTFTLFFLRNSLSREDNYGSSKPPGGASGGGGSMNNPPPATEPTWPPAEPAGGGSWPPAQAAPAPAVSGGAGGGGAWGNTKAYRHSDDL